MLEWFLAVIFLGLLIWYLWVSLKREPFEEIDADPVEAIDSFRAALPVEVRASDFAALSAADEELSRRPRVPAITTPLPTLNQGSI